jgi:hypothetical protein
LRSQLQNLLDELPQDLPTYYHEELLGAYYISSFQALSDNRAR